MLQFLVEQVLVWKESFCYIGMVVEIKYDRLEVHLTFKMQIMQGFSD